MAMANVNVRTDAEIKAKFRNNVPNETTLAAFREGDVLLADPTSKGYTSISDLRAALDV